MKLYTTPGGQWAGTEKDWKDALRSEGVDPKTYTGRRQVEVPTQKAALMEFLTFHNVNVIDPIGSRAAAPPAVAPQEEVSPPAPHPAADTPFDGDAYVESIPINYALHLAALIVERARTSLRSI